MITTPPTTPKNAHGSRCAILRARLRLALTTPPPGNLAFLTRQATAEKRQVEQARRTGEQIRLFARLVSDCINGAINRLEAEKKKPSQRRIAGLLGLPESTLRKCRAHPARALAHRPRFESALQSLQPH